MASTWKTLIFQRSTTDVCGVSEIASMTLNSSGLDEYQRVGLRLLFSSIMDGIERQEPSNRGLEEFYARNTVTVVARWITCCLPTANFDATRFFMMYSISHICPYSWLPIKPRSRVSGFEK